VVVARIAARTHTPLTVMASLTVEQRRAVEFPQLDCHVLVNATAGSGKSETMIQRIRYMIEHLSVQPQHIMCITYTRTAGCNMEMRIKRELQRYQANLPMVEYCDTFHAISRNVLHKLGMLNTRNDLCDIDEVMVQFLEFLQSNTAASIAFKRTIKYLFIDEFQDINELMCRIADEFRRSGTTIFAVGDDLQCIMSFQGSSVRFIRDFPQLFMPCSVFNLSVNFRCSDPIIKLANAVVGSGRVHEYIQKPQPISCEEYLYYKPAAEAGEPLPAHIDPTIFGAPSRPDAALLLSPGEEALLQRIVDGPPPPLQPAPVARPAFVSRAPKPRLEHCKDAFTALDSTCEEIIALLRPPLGAIKPHHICILSRSGYFLHQAHAKLLGAGVKCIFLRDANGRKDPNGPAAQSVEELCKDRVILSTMHGAKGMEFDRGYILTLSKRHMPDSREPDVDAERRLLNVAITRFRSHVVIWNVFDQASLFVRELYDKYPGALMNGMVQTGVPALLQPHVEVMLEQVQEAKREEKRQKDIAYDALNPISDIHKQYLDVDTWVGSLNGTTYRKLRQTILPFPLPFRIRNAPNLYVVPAAMGLAAAAALAMGPAAAVAAAPAVAVPVAAAAAVVEEAKEEKEPAAAAVPHALFGNASDEEEEDGDENDYYDEQEDDADGDVDMYEPDHFGEEDPGEGEDEEEEEVLASFRSPWHITINSLEESAHNFLDAAMLRFVQEMRRTQELACTGTTTITKYVFEPAEDCFSQLRRRGQNIDKKHKQRIAFDYQDYQNVNKPWRTILRSIYWASAASSLRLAKCAMMYTPMSNQALEPYVPLMDEMYRTLHHLIFDRRYAPHDGHTVEWQVMTFYHLPTTGRSAGSNSHCFVLVGERMILWCNDPSNHGSFPVEVVLKALCYASLVVLENNSKVVAAAEAAGAEAGSVPAPPPCVRRVQIYHAFSRKICDVTLGNWSRHQEMIDFLATNRRDIYHFD
jgi:hypothetical protein